MATFLDSLKHFYTDQIDEGLDEHGSFSFRCNYKIKEWCEHRKDQVSTSKKVKQIKRSIKYAATVFKMPFFQGLVPGFFVLFTTPSILCIALEIAI